VCRNCVSYRLPLRIKQTPFFVFLFILALKAYRRRSLLSLVSALERVMVILKYDRRGKNDVTYVLLVFVFFYIYVFMSVFLGAWLGGMFSPYNHFLGGRF
jgi:hypothetical protein